MSTKPNWHPASEPPDDGRDVLIRLNDGRRFVAVHKPNECGYDWASVPGNYIYQANVVHGWRELPGPDEPEGPSAAAECERLRAEVAELTKRLHAAIADRIPFAEAYAKPVEQDRDSARAALARADACVEALREIAAEIQQSNGGKGPSLPLSIFVLSIATKALAAYDAQPKEQK